MNNENKEAACEEISAERMAAREASKEAAKERVKKRKRNKLIIKAVLWLITAALLVIGIALDGKGIISIIFLGGAVLAGFITVAITFWWDSSIYKTGHWEDD